MAITFFGAATTPADNSGSSLGPTVTLTPPASMLDGDLVYVSVRYRDSAATIATTPSNDGGQTWNATTQYNATNIRARVFWCRFNGTWSANPAFTVTSGTNNIDAQMLVFRPTSTAITWTLESGSNSATYTAPSSPFTVTITGRTTTAASTITIGAWHSVDDNTWGTLSGTGWSKTSLTAQYRNNDTADNSSSFAYYIATAASTAIPNVSQNQTALGGDAGSTSLFTFAETAVTSVPTGVAATATAGSEAISIAEVGLFGVEATTAAGTTVGVPSGATNGSAIPDGVAATAQAGAATTPGSAIVIPVSAGVGCSAGIISASVKAFPVGVAATAAAGSASGLASGLGTASPGGVSSTATAGSLASATAIVGIVGVSSTAAVGLLVGNASGIQHGAGQPTGIFITASAGSPSMAVGVNVLGVSSAAIAESLDASLSTAEIDGAAATAAAGAPVLNNVAPIQGVSSSCVAGSPAQTWNAVTLVVGVSAVATTGTATGFSNATAAVAVQGVSANALAGSPAATHSAVAPITGVAATASTNDVATSGGDTIPDEASPAGVFASAQAGTIVIPGTVVSPFGVAAVARVGNVFDSEHSPANVTDIRAGAESRGRRATANIRGVRASGRSNR